MSEGELTGRTRIVCTLDDVLEASAVSQILDAEGVSYMIRTFEDTAYDGLFTQTKGWGQVIVMEADADRARDLLAEYLERSEGASGTRPEVAQAASAAPLPDGLVIAEVSPGDLPDLRGLHAQLVSERTLGGGAHEADPDRAEEVARQISRDTDIYLLLARRGGRVVGSLCLHIMPSLLGPALPWGQVEDLIVDEGSRRRGVGRALMEVAEGIARARGCLRLTLTCHDSREAARALYASLGFTEASTAFRKPL